MGFLVVVGVLQFAYCVLVGNYVSFFLALLSLLYYRERENGKRIGIGCGLQERERENGKKQIDTHESPGMEM